MGFKNLVEVDNLLNFYYDKECIVLSPHKSKENRPAITVHIPGNPCNALFYGKEKTLNISNPLIFYRLYIETYKLIKENGLNIELTYEADHHGPTIDKPILFYELGSSEKEWDNEELCNLMANAIKNVISSKENPSFIACYFGGNHYAKRCNDLTLKYGYAFSHIIAKYNISCLDKDVFIQALNKSTAEKDIILIEKKIIKEEREKIIGWAEELNVEYKII